METLMGRERNKKLYDREFKLNALKLLEKGEVSMTKLAKDLGVNINTLSNWRKQYAKNAEKAFERTIELSPEQKRIRELEKQLKHALTGNEILKKASDFFAGADK
ncbi:transposase [bacterium]|nr:transposase [bacterium]